jgi:hypothetical protein
MLNRHKLLRTIIFLFVLVIGNSYKNDSAIMADSLNGAWQFKSAEGEQVLICIDGYLTHTKYALTQKKFAVTRGGPYKLNGDNLEILFEFNSSDRNEVGTAKAYTARINGDKLETDIDGNRVKWTKLDAGDGLLAGNWQITGRMQGDKLNEMRPGARKTIKILSGTRFQWAAINTETKEFSGSGGGKYSFKNGKYTEYIEFFSRDSSRVGASLSFDGKVEDGKWIHKGLSSRGENIHEIWSRSAAR